MESEEKKQLTRSDMLERLQMRYLFLPNGETMPLVELQQIYKNFIVPREQRVRIRPLDVNAAAAGATSRNDELSLQMEQLMKLDEGVESAKKRKWGEEQMFNDLLLSQTAKRLKIHSP